MKKRVSPRSDLAVEAFRVLRRAFFDEEARPIAFPLRDKRNTQDDPFDEYAHQLLDKGLPTVQCEKAPGSLTTPDLVLFRREHCDGASRKALRDDQTRIVGIEVKKIERSVGGRVARASGMDYNTTPPCGTVRVYDATNRELLIHAFYLFVCQERVAERSYRLTALALCDGNVLNEDFELYTRITSSRLKEINLGTYRDGADRQRPMLIFANPLGCPELDHAVTLIHRSKNVEKSFRDLRLTYTLTRQADNGPRTFYCYRNREDVSKDWGVRRMVEPFPSPSRREKTQGRGRFRLSIRPE